jgi:hypothetical protein
VQGLLLPCHLFIIVGIFLLKAFPIRIIRFVGGKDRMWIQKMNFNDPFASNDFIGVGKFFSK